MKIIGYHSPCGFSHPVHSLAEMNRDCQEGKVVTLRGVVGIIKEVEQEDGSGKCWNIRVQPVLSTDLKKGLVTPWGCERWIFCYAC